MLVLDRLIEIAHAEGCKKIILETSHAQDLYLKRGFTVDHQRTERGVNLDVMSLDITSYGKNS